MKSGLKILVILIISCSYHTHGYPRVINGLGNEERRLDMIIDIINKNLKINAWNTILCVGHLPQYLYDKMKFLPFAFAITNLENDDHYVNDVVPYRSNTIIVNCVNVSEFDIAIRKVIGSPYWHAHSNVVLYLHTTEDKNTIAKIFYAFWYYKFSNAIIVQYDGSNTRIFVSYYNPFNSENYRLKNVFGCWTLRKITIPVADFENGFMCARECDSVTLHSKKRAFYYGTCIGFDTHEIRYGDFESLRKLNLFEDKGKNLHGYTLRAHFPQVLPFFRVTKENNATYTFSNRDGKIWSTVMKLLNFTLDLTPNLRMVNEKFKFAINIQYVDEFARRKVDLFLNPVYQLDMMFVEIDLCVPHKESGVCLLAHKAELETVLFDIKLLQDKYKLVILAALCMFSIWLVFFIFNAAEKGSISFDQAGKDFVNTVRNALLITLYKPPKWESFRIFLAVSLWCFFILNFSSQAAITSFFTAYKRGKEVDTFEDVIEKGFNIEGITSPDVILPDNEERFRKINSMMSPTENIFDCVNRISNDSRRFCLIDCSIGRYLERNKLNEKGEQYLHILKDRIHSHYLTILQQKHSVLTPHFNKFIMALFEGGIIRKWEQYRYNTIKEEVVVKSISVGDLKGIFNGYCFLLGLSFVIFVLEVLFFCLKSIIINCRKKVLKRQRK